MRISADVIELLAEHLRCSWRVTAHWEATGRWSASILMAFLIRAVPLEFDGRVQRAQRIQKHLPIV